MPNQNPDKKAVLTRGKIKRNMLGKKAFLIVIMITVFIINSNNQELIHHIHFFWMYILSSKQDKEIMLIS